MLTTACLAAPARSQEAPARPDGYEFGRPRLLTQQLIWGLAHGVKLLAETCRGQENGEAVAKAYAGWLERYDQRIQGAARELSRHYFGQDAAAVEALNAALHLKARLDLPPDDLASVCSSAVQAINAPRHDLDLFYALRRDAARVERAEAVRGRVAACLDKLVAEPAADLAARFSTWAQANELFEDVSRSRLLTLKGDSADDRQWRRDAGAGAVPPAANCDRLAGELAGPAYALRNVFGEEGQ
jgi:hypothetical protein